MTSLRLNLGCGAHPIKGYINLDKIYDWEFEDGLPSFDDGSAEVITISHSLMYVEEEDYPMVFAEFARVLKEGGILRITEDSTDDKKSERYGGYKDAVTLTSMFKIAKYLGAAGFAAIPVSFDKTNFYDHSPLQAHHGREPKVFFIEGIKLNSMAKFKESALAHHLLDGLKGIEIGGSAHNDYGLNTKNVDFTDDMNTVFKEAEKALCGEKMKVDIVAEGDQLPFENGKWDFVLASHVIEHFFDPIKTIQEWLRVVKPGGYVYMVVPRVDCVPDEHRPCTPLQEFIDRHNGKMKPEEVNFEGSHGGKSDRGHWSVWNSQTFIQMCNHFEFNIFTVQAIDDKVGNGFTIVLQKPDVE
jgi:ubiquinone/menaquinone biosynthesis C-methylase UbiE